jgi:membrane protease YdiL (CAAX protease family)
MSVEGLTPRMTAVAEVLLCSSVPTQVFIASILGIVGWMPFDEAGQLSLRFVVTLSVVDTVVLVGLMVALTVAHGERVQDLWLGSRPVRREAMIGALLIPVVFFLVVVLLTVLMAVAPWLHNVPTNPLEQMAGTAGGAALLAIVAILAGGVREELQRAFLLRRFERHLGGAAAGVVVLSVAFGLGHVVQGWDAVITTGLLGAFWAVLYLRRRSAVAPLVSHAGFNALEVLRAALTGQ